MKRARFMAAALLAAVAAACFTAEARADGAFQTPAEPWIISSNIDPATQYYSILNFLIGADRFYNAGYFGGNTVIANIEAGHVWNGHETLSRVTSYVSNAPINATQNQYDYHATMVGFVIVGLGPVTPEGLFLYQLGVAPISFLSSVAIATQFYGDGSFDLSASSFAYGYRTAMRDGVEVPFLPGINIQRPADVINSSFGYDDPTGSNQGTWIVDALAAANRQTVVIAAGNHNQGPAKVAGPASGFNLISVGALTSDLSVPPYHYLAGFSNTGPNDFFNPQTGETVPGVRAAVSISAPGTNLILPAYTGSTGSNISGTLFDVSSIPPDELDTLYFLDVQGTSFAAPLVSGGAALMVDAGYDRFAGGPSVDGRTIKAVLLNSADKVAGWTNNTVNENGVLRTSQGLDWNLGAGALNLSRAFDQYLSGTTDLPGLNGGTVQNIGWDYGRVTAQTAQRYTLDTPLAQGDTLVATLTWFIDTYFNADATADPVTDTFSEADLHATYFDQLSLQVWRLDNGLPERLIAESTSPYNNVAHLYFDVPEDGEYGLRVLWMGTTYNIDNSSPFADDYAIAWAVVPVPEPGTLAVLVPVLLMMRRGVRGQSRERKARG